MRIRVRSGADGQTLIQVALALTVLFAFVAFAVDFGRAYQERRRLQNAADAGALAAARTYCFGGPSGTYGTVAQAIAAGNLYATSLDYNGAQDSETTASADQYTYTVTTTEDVPMTFASVVGLPNVTVHAVAAAKCGGATSGCGMWPVAFREELWDALYKKACPVVGKPKSLYIWAGYHGGSGCGNPNDPTCCVDPSDPFCTGVCEDKNCQDPQCGYLYDCDTDGDGVQDVMADQGRAWLDFSNVPADPYYPSPGKCPDTGCGAAELGECIADSSPVKVIPPLCISGDRGVKGGVKRDVESRAEDIIAIPLFEYMGCPISPKTCLESYYITDFGCIKVAKNPWVHLTLSSCDGVNHCDAAAPSGTPNKWHGWVVETTVACDGCITNCGGTGGDPVPTPEPGGLRAVSLIR